MKNLLNKIIWFMAVSMLVLSCPVTAEDGSSASASEEPPQTSEEPPKKLYYSKAFKDGVGGVDGLDGARSVTVSPDGKNVYVAGAIDNALAVFTRDTTTGALTYSKAFKDGAGGVDGLDGAISITVSPDGKNVYVASWDEDAVAVFTRDTTTGALTYSTVFKDSAGGVDGLSGARSVMVSPDGKNVYVAGATDSALAVFTRDTTTGALTYSTVFKDGVGGVDGLNGASGVVVSPDGKNVYVAASSDKALAVFTRDTTTGALTYSTVLKDGAGGVDGLDGAISIAVSPDGKNVYVVSYDEHATAVFRRNTNDGTLSYSTALKDGEGGVDGLRNAISVTASPDGTNVYVTGWGEDAVAVFGRSTNNDGALTYSEVFKDGIGGVDGFDGAQSVAESPDGKNVYVVSNGDDALVVFERR